MQISYYPLAVSEKGFLPALMFLAQLPGVRKICEIGGGANPALDLAFIQQHNLDYTILDICQEELDKAPEDYHKICCDITDENQAFSGTFDLMFSQMVAEHIQCASKFHSNVFRLLSPGGIAFHFFPTLYSFPFVVNWLTPDGLAEAALDIIAPRDKYRKAKFKAYYDWCYGPTDSNIRRLQNIGYAIQQYIGFFGHGYYEEYGPIQWIHEKESNMLLKHPNPNLTSYTFLMLARSQSENALAGHEAALHTLLKASSI
jgi:SAM-dependent methyltransferase